jgi:hypothetical protein
MRTAGLSVWFVIAVALIPTDAFAQRTTNGPAARGLYNWDIAGTCGLAIIGKDGASAPFGGEHAGATAWNLDVGRYLSTHLKIDGGLLATTSYYNSNPRSFPVPGLPSEYYYVTWAQTKNRLTGFSAAATYQFFENQYAHPFVSAGVAVMREEVHSVRPAHTVTLNRVPYTIPAVDDRTATVSARPFVAAGWKSYFDERVFIRSEVLVAMRRDGFSHATMRIGAGFDF